ncbi:MAG TPA: hypothetical protein VFZ29_04520 [Solirubrobacterales bacterium]
MLWDRLTELGWPDYTPPHCPSALAREARRAFTGFLTEVAADPPFSAGDVPDLDPEYVLDEEFGLAIAIDFAEHGDERLIGAASRYSNWERQVDAIQVKPSPPREVPLVTEPQQVLEKEIDLRVAKVLVGRRITIVGGRRSTPIVERICQCFGPEVAQIRWLEAEPNKSPNLDGLENVRPETDVVICITGAIGHPESDTVARRSRRGGLEPVLVERRSEIETALRARYGKGGPTR